MQSAPILTLYTFTLKSTLGEERWTDRGSPDFFFDDREAARLELLEAREELASDLNDALCLEKIETVPMTETAIVALLNHGVEAIINRYEIIEEVARA